MPFTPYEASAPVFVATLGNMRAWLDKADPAEEARLIGARLIDDMRPLAAQYQMASDTAKNTIARLAGIEAPRMEDNEATFAELRDRMDRTIAFIAGVDPAVIAGSDTRTVELKFPNGMGYRHAGGAYLTGFALPNFFFHATAAYAILRAQGVKLDKPDFLQHLGAPAQL